MSDLIVIGYPRREDGPYVLGGLVSLSADVFWSTSTNAAHPGATYKGAHITTAPTGGAGGELGLCLRARGLLGSGWD